MSSLKTITCFVLIFAITFACSETENIEPVNRSSNDLEAFEGFMEVKPVNVKPVNYLPLTLEMQYSGQGNSNKMGDFNIKTSHLEQIALGTQEFFISAGYFTIDDHDGNSIYGSYNGSGSTSPSHPRQNWYFQVEGGIGDFAQATGRFTVSLENQKSALSANTLKAVLQGILNENPSGL